MKRRGRRTKYLVAMAQSRFYGCEVCNNSNSSDFLEEIFERCGFTKKEMKRVERDITCPGCESNMDMMDQVAAYSAEELRFENTVLRQTPKFLKLQNFIMAYPSLAASHETAKELERAVKRARITVLHPRDWYRCVGGKKINNEAVFPRQPQRAYRFNHSGQMAFYLAEKPEGAVIEILQGKKQEDRTGGLWIADVAIRSPLRVLDVRMIMPFMDHYKGQPSLLQTLLAVGLLRRKKNRTGQFQPQYLETRLIADLVRRRKLDGIYYTSCQEYPFRDDVFGTNLVIFNPNYRTFTEVKALSRIKWMKAKEDAGLFGLPVMVIQKK
jgi:hypothetical protein